MVEFDKCSTVLHSGGLGNILDMPINYILLNLVEFYRLYFNVKFVF